MKNEQIPTPKPNLDQPIVVAGINWRAHLTPSENCDAPSMLNETTGVHYFDQRSAVLHAFEQNMRLPTVAEILQLYDRTTRRFEKIGKTKYYVFIDKETKAELWMVFSGWYDFEDGAFYQVGIRGYLWSSSVVDACSGFSLEIPESLSVLPRGQNNRASAFPVRCVME